MSTDTAQDTRIEGEGASGFFTDTLVHMKGGGALEIQFLGPGDIVLSRSKETGELAYRKVIRNFESDDIAGKQVYRIEYSPRNESTPKLYATAAHTVWVETIGWVKMCNVRIGQLLRLRDDTLGPVVAVHCLGDGYAVHNLEIEDFHSFFVNDLGVWVGDGVQQG